MTLGEKLQNRRTELGLSQERLAEMVGVSRQAVSKWEVGDATPDTAKLLPLARALGMTADELLADEEEQPPDGSQEPGQKQGWLALHWYWAGLLPIIWGAYLCGRAVNTALRAYQNIKVLAPLMHMGLPAISYAGLTPYLDEAGNIDYGTVFLPLAGNLLLGLVAAVVGVLIIVLGLRHVRKKYKR